MSISYSAITNRGKVNLPSVDAWGKNINILRDPPKSITTRKKNRVGSSSSITETIDESGNRACEAILQFARGVNPSVSVSYDNNGNNSGRSGSNLQVGGQTQAFLPYTVAKDGAFRPPIVTQEQLYPLSRLPRLPTKASTQPGFVDYSKKVFNCGTAKETKQVKNDLLKTSVRPTGYYKIETPQSKPFEVKYVIQPVLNKSCISGVSSTDTTTQNVLEPTKEVNRNLLHTYATSNINTTNYVNNNEFNPDRFLQNTNPHSVYSNAGLNIQTNYISDVADLSNIRTKDLQNVTYISAKSGNGENNYIHDDIELSRVLPGHTAISNMNGGYEKTDYIHDDIELSRVLPGHTAISNMNGGYEKTDYIHDDIELYRVLPEHSAISNIHGDKNYDYIHDDIKLSRVIPEYNTNTNMNGYEKTDYIHDDIELERVLPEHTAITNIKHDGQKNVSHEYMIPLYRTSSANANTNINISQQGESNISSRQYNLVEKINPGGYNIPGQIPMQDRMQNVEIFQDTNKSKIEKYVAKQYQGRYQ